MGKGVWTLQNHEDAAEVRARLQQGSTTRIELTKLLRDQLRLWLALGLLREQNVIGCDPPFDCRERAAPRRYWLVGVAP